MSATVLTAPELLGLFELDDDGKVLYYRSDSADLLPDITGHNFYDEVARFENVADFRRCVADFTHSAKAADSFDFDCNYKTSNQSVRVLVARIRESENQNNTKSVLVHIRPGINTHKTQKYQR
jgi:ferredoxin